MKLLLISTMSSLLTSGFAHASAAPVVESLRFLNLNGAPMTSSTKNPKKFEPSVIELKIKNIAWQSYKTTTDLSLSWSLSGRQCVEGPKPDGTMGWFCQQGISETHYIDLSGDTSGDRINFHSDRWRARLVAVDGQSATFILVVSPDWKGRSNELNIKSVETIKLDSVLITENGKDDIEFTFEDGDLSAQKSISLTPLSPLRKR